MMSMLYHKLYVNFDTQLLKLMALREPKIIFYCFKVAIAIYSNSKVTIKSNDSSVPYTNFNR